jgi:broad specificity phosphatase PhoE
LGPTILTLVRHGQTAANVDRVWHGSIDTPLSEVGRAQARRLGAHVAAAYRDVAAVYASPLSRARDTAQAIASTLSLEVLSDGDLSEFSLGEWEGRTYADLHHAEGMWQRMADDPDYAPPGGESPRSVATRVERALRRIALAHEGSRTVVVSHGGAFNLGLGLVLDGRPNSWSRVVDNCSVSELVLEPEPRLLSFNETEHLGDVAEGGGPWVKKLERELVGPDSG